MPMADATPDLLDALVASRCRFDVATPGEVEASRDLGLEPDRLVWTDPAGVAYARRRGIGLFAAYDRGGIDRLAAAAPGLQVIVRPAVCSPDTPLALTVRAALRGLEVAGIGVRSVAVDEGGEPEPHWGAATRLYRDLRRIGVEVALLDVPLDGGLPRLQRIRTSYAEQVGGARPGLVVSVPRIAGST